MENKKESVIFEGVSHLYGKRRVLSNINLRFENDKITVILGKSGGGKTTLLQMINGLLVPSEGIVKVFGDKIDYDQIHLLRHSIGYTVQGTGLFPHMTVYQNIALLARICKYDTDKTDQRIKILMHFVDLDSGYKNKYPYQLSGGEQQRVGICRAMILNPRIFLLDEPFGALDITTRNEIHEELFTLQEAEPRTIIMVTHDVNEAFKLADKILILNEGEIQQYDMPEQIIKNPANQFVEKLIQSQKI